MVWYCWQSKQPNLCVFVSKQMFTSRLCFAGHRDLQQLQPAPIPANRSSPVTAPATPLATNRSVVPRPPSPRLAPPPPSPPPSPRVLRSSPPPPPSPIKVLPAAAALAGAGAPVPAPQVVCCLALSITCLYHIHIMHLCIGR